MQSLSPPEKKSKGRATRRRPPGSIICDDATVAQPWAIPDGYVALILDQHSKNPFSVFGTHTVAFDRPGNIHPERLTKLYRVWCSMVNEELYGARWYKRGQSVQCVVAWELQKRGVWHLHTLMRGEGVERLLMPPLHSWARNAWWELSGTCKLLPIDRICGVSGYLSKYVTKGGQIDFEPTRAWDLVIASGDTRNLFPTSKEQVGILVGENVGQQGKRASDGTQLALLPPAALEVEGLWSPTLARPCFPRAPRP